MPIIKSAIKRAKQTVVRRERNIATKAKIKEATKAFTAKPSAAGLSASQSEIDTAVKKGLIKKNTAARRKSKLSAIAKNAGVKLNTTKKAKTVSPAAKPVEKKENTATIKKPVTKKTTSTAKKLVAKKPASKKTTK